jgi:hypothetical protein
MTFVPYGELGERPNVIVDGAPLPSTRVTLSHWPGSPTPVEVLDDLSAQIAFRALAHPEWFRGIDAVSNNHYDQDGLASAFALIDPAVACEHRHRAIDVARAGDFAVYHNRDAMRVAITLAAYADPDVSPLGRDALSGPYEQQCAVLYQALLPRFAEFLDDPSTTRPLWENEDAHLQASLDAIDDGVVTIEENPAVDLAVVRIPEGWAERTTTRFAVSREDAVHNAAVNQATGCFRLARLQGRSYQVEFRYESWVMYRSRPVLPRPDLRVLASTLNDLEGDARWTATPPGALTPILRLDQPESTLAPDEFVAHLERFLTDAPPAWDPYAPRS